MKKNKRLTVQKIRQNALADYLNWGFFENNFLVTKNSLLLAFFMIIPHTDYYSAAEDDNIASMWNRFSMLVPDNVTCWYEYNKFIPELPLYPDCSNLFSGFADRQLESLRVAEFNSGSNYIANRYLTLAFSPTVTSVGLSEISISEFEKLITDMIGRFASVKITARRMTKAEICTYLHSCISTKRYPIAVPSASTNALSDALWDDDIDPTLIPLKLGKKLISAIAIDDFPESGTSAEMLSRLTSVDGTIRWVTRYTFKSPDEAKKLIDMRRRQYYSRRFSAKDIAASTMFNSSIELMDSGELSKYQECELALAENGSEVSFGFYTGIIVFEADSEKELESISSEVQGILAKYGFVYRVETLNLFASWLSSLPGNTEANPRKQFISTGNLSCLLSLTAPYEGEKENQLMKEITGCGLPHAVGLLPNNALYYLNLNGRGNSGHTFIIGPTGSGKSILLSFLAASWGKYPSSRVIIFDKGASSKTLVASNGGAIYYPGQEQDQTCFQPLKDARKNIERSMRFLNAIASVQNVELSATDREEMVDALKLMIPGHESLSVFRDILQGKNHNSQLVAALSNYTLGGTYGNLFDAEEDTLKPSCWPHMTMIEIGELMRRGDAAIIPALTYIIGQLDELFEDKVPTLLILDEAWVCMRHPVFKGFIETWLKTLRKYNVFVILATQEVSDYDEVIGSVLTNCHTKILLPNNQAKTGPLASLYKGIGLTEAEMTVISNDISMRSQKDYFIMQEEGNAIVDFAISNEQLEYLRGII